MPLRNTLGIQIVAVLMDKDMMSVLSTEYLVHIVYVDTIT